MPAPITIQPYQAKGCTGLDVRINDEGATVQDYTEALDDYIISGQYRRQRSTSANCEGCDICCQERIPLTSVDVLILKGQVAPELSVNEFIQRYGYVSVSGPAADISLGRDWQDRCLFLHPETGKCRNYAARPLVCRTYICTPLSPRAGKLRETLVNLGMDELVRLMLAASPEGQYPLHEADEPELVREDWPESLWTGITDYSQLRLKDILPAKLYAELRKGEQGV